MWKRLWGYELRSVIAKLVFGFCASKYLDKASGHIVDLRDVFFGLEQENGHSRMLYSPAPYTVRKYWRAKHLHSQLTQNLNRHGPPQLKAVQIVRPEVDTAINATHPGLFSCLIETGKSSVEMSIESLAMVLTRGH